jgi:hypothetical protein
MCPDKVRVHAEDWSSDFFRTFMRQGSDASHLRPLANLEVSRKIGWIHIICYFTKNTYGIYSSFIYIHTKQIHIRNQLDTAYLALFIGLLISWIFFLDECLISYFVKKINNPKYKLGDDSDNMEDMIILFENKDKYKQFENTMTICYFVSLYIVAYRSSDYIIPYLFGMFPKSYYFLVEIKTIWATFFLLLYFSYIFSYKLLKYK